jgi:flagellar FliL protein
MSEIDAGADEAVQTTAGGGRKKGLLIGVAVLVALCGAGAAAWFGGLFGSDQAAPEAEPEAPPIYFEVDSNLIVNFEGGGRVRYLQLGVQVMTRDPAVVEILKQHHPVIRNNLIMLFGEQKLETLSSREGKTMLAAAGLAEVQAVVREFYGKPGVEALYFTTFVMQ